MVLHHRQLSTFEIMTVVGHSSIAMLRLYANLRGEELVERIDGVGAQQSMLERLGSILRTHEALVASLDARNTSARHPEVVAPPKLGMVFTSQPLTATKFSISWGSTPYRLAA